MIPRHTAFTEWALRKLLQKEEVNAAALKTLSLETSLPLVIAVSVGETHLSVVSTSSFSFLQCQGQGFISSSHGTYLKARAGVLVKCQRSSGCKAEIVPQTSPKLYPDKSVYGFSGTMAVNEVPEKRQAMDLEV